jgi:hypothetical protein
LLSWLPNKKTDLEVLMFACLGLLLNWLVPAYTPVFKPNWPLARVKYAQAAINLIAIAVSNTPTPVPAPWLRALAHPALRA